MLRIVGPKTEKVKQWQDDAPMSEGLTINAVSKQGQYPVFRITKAYGDPQMWRSSAEQVTTQDKYLLKKLQIFNET
jgi:hypothetical protein